MMSGSTQHAAPAQHSFVSVLWALISFSGQPLDRLVKRKSLHKLPIVDEKLLFPYSVEILNIGPHKSFNLTGVGCSFQQQP